MLATLIILWSACQNSLFILHTFVQYPWWLTKNRSRRVRRSRYDINCVLRTMPDHTFCATKFKKQNCFTAKFLGFYLFKRLMRGSEWNVHSKGAYSVWVTRFGHTFMPSNPKNETVFSSWSTTSFVCDINRLREISTGNISSYSWKWKQIALRE